MSRRFASFVVVALVTAACTGQTTPSRGALPDLGVYEPDQVYDVPDDARFPADGSCGVAAGSGARIIEFAGSKPQGDLRLSDVIVAVDDMAVGSREDLFAKLTGYGPGDEVTVRVRRDGADHNVEVVLQTDPNGSDRGLIGIVPATSYSTHPPADVPVRDSLGIVPRPVYLAERVYEFDPVSTGWRLVATGIEATTGGTVGLGDELYEVRTAESGTTEIVGLLGEAAVEVDRGGWELLGALSGLGNYLLVSAIEQPGGAADDTRDAAVIAFDVRTGARSWEWRTGLSPNGFPVTPTVGFRNPLGTTAAITLTEQVPAGVPGHRFHVLLNRRGQDVSGWGAEQRRFVPDDTVLAGFYDDYTLVFGARIDTGLRYIRYSVVSRENEGSVDFDVPEGAPSPGVLAVGDGRHLLLASGTDVSLVDAERSARRLLMRGCSVVLSDYGFGL